MRTVTQPWKQLKNVFSVLTKYTMQQNFHNRNRKFVLQTEGVVSLNAIGWIMGNVGFSNKEKCMQHVCHQEKKKMEKQLMVSPWKQT